MIVTFLVTKCGDQIIQQAEGLALDILSPNWMGFNKDIQKDLLKIGEITRREVIGKSRTMFPTNSSTFLDVSFSKYFQNLCLIFLF